VTIFPLFLLKAIFASYSSAIIALNICFPGNINLDSLVILVHRVWDSDGHVPIRHGQVHVTLLEGPQQQIGMGL